MMRAMTALQLEHLAVHAGFPAKAKVVMAAIALAESNGGARPYGDCYGTVGCTSFGPWQVHVMDEAGGAVNTLPGGRPYDTHRLVHDPLYSAHAALAVYRSQGLGAWSTYDHGHGAYLAYLPAAQWAAGHDRRLAMRAAKHHHHRSPEQRFHHRAHVQRTVHHAKSATATPLSAMGLEFIGALCLFASLQILGKLRIAFGVAVRQEAAIIRRAARQREYRAEQALRKRTMPRTARRLALNTQS